MKKSVKDTAKRSYTPRAFSVAESSMQRITAKREAITAEREAAAKAAADNAAIKNANGIAVGQLISLANFEMSKWQNTAKEATNPETIEQVLSKKKKLNDLIEETLLQLPDLTDLSKKEFFSESDFSKCSESKREIVDKKDELFKLETALRDNQSKGKGRTKKRKSRRRKITHRRRRNKRHIKSTRRRRRKH
jgi:uncharacterized damage-inducible protein DinB